MKAQGNYSSIDGIHADAENTTTYPVYHIRCASRQRPALALSVLDVVAAGKDSVQAQSASLPKVVTIRK